MSEREIKEKILKQLEIGACCRTHIHNECRHIFGLEEIGVNRSSDRRFDIPFDKLVDDKCVRKIQPTTLTIGTIDGKNKEWESVELETIIALSNKKIEKFGKYAFYEITKEGKLYLKTL